MWKILPKNTAGRRPLLSADWIDAVTDAEPEVERLISAAEDFGKRNTK